MKTKLLLTAALSFCLAASAQKLEVGLGIGSGLSYLVEDWSGGRLGGLSYAPPFAGYGHLAYAPEASYFSLKLGFQYIATGIKGVSWPLDRQLSGEVSTLTTLLMLERLPDNRTVNWGYQFGFGYTQEDFLLAWRDVNSRRRYLSVNLAAICSVKLSERMRLQITPGLLWTDPANTLRLSQPYVSGREDLSALLQAGVAYRLQ